MQDGSSHYLKGVTLTLAYIVIGACFFVQHVPLGNNLITFIFILFKNNIININNLLINFSWFVCLLLGVQMNQITTWHRLEML